MKITCLGCLAYKRDKNSISCILHYKQKIHEQFIYGQSFKHATPLEKCPKPITKKELIKLIKERDNFIHNIKDK